MVLSRVRLIRVGLVLVNLNPINDTYICIRPLFFRGKKNISCKLLSLVLFPKFIVDVKTPFQHAYAKERVVEARRMRMQASLASRGARRQQCYSAPATYIHTPPHTRTHTHTDNMRNTCARAHCIAHYDSLQLTSRMHKTKDKGKRAHGQKRNNACLQADVNTCRSRAGGRHTCNAYLRA